MTRVSLIGTLLNEAQSVVALLDSIVAQSRAPDEIVLVDGGSRDGSADAIRAWSARHPALHLRLLVEPGANISRGRNLAAAAASGDVFAITDCGVVLPPDWLERLVAPFESSHPPEAVSGFFAADPRSLFEFALGAATLPGRSEIRPESFLPSSRSFAISRAAWWRSGGYPEWLDYCEDLILDLNLRRLGIKFAWVPGAEVRFRPRDSPRAFALQYFRYARGDGKADLWRKRHTIRYLAYLGGPVLLRLAPRRWAIPLLALGACFYLRQPARRLLERRDSRSLGELMLAAAMLPWLIALGDIAKMAGYPVGVLWRLRQHPPDWRVQGQ